MCDGAATRCSAKQGLGGASTVVQVAVDADAHTLTFGWNGNLKARMSEPSASAKIAGTVYPVVSLGSSEVVGLRLGGNASTALSHEPPEGFQPLGALLRRARVAATKAPRLAPVPYPG